MPTNLHELSLVEAADAVMAGKVSPVEPTRASLDEIERWQNLNAFSIVMADEAISDARRLEADAARGVCRGPLHGVPIAVKDLCDVSGVATAAGISVFRDRVAHADSTVVRRLREAGAIILGKIELAEGALAFHHPEVAAPVNPWKPELWPGTSSSGSGVAVGADRCFGAIGTDTGGSIRFPSLCNGIVGIKPTWGRVSRLGIYPLSWTLDHVGPMARRVEDAAAMLSVIWPDLHRRNILLQQALRALASVVEEGLQTGRLDPITRGTREGRRRHCHDDLTIVSGNTPRTRGDDRRRLRKPLFLKGDRRPRDFGQQTGITFLSGY